MARAVPWAAAFLLLSGAACPAPARPAPGRHAGLLQPEAQVTLRARLPGLVVEIPRAEGAAVQPGEAVVVLDDAELQVAVDMARRDLEAADLNFQRVKNGPREEEAKKVRLAFDEAKARVDLEDSALEADRKLYEKKMLSEMSWQRSVRSLEAAKAFAEARRLDLSMLEKGPTPAELRLSQLEVERKKAVLQAAERNAARSRIAGTRRGRAFVSRVLVEAGSWVDAGKEVAELVYMDRLRVQLDLPAPEGLAAVAGSRAVIRSAMFPGVDLPARLARVAPVVDPGAGTVRAFIEAENPDLRMRPGAACEVEILPAGDK